jgi:hypothetical protein|tara:strand:- start:12916 stop:13344 length:429 start_codon:yes stop_codon:yes gene_type:complete
MSNREAIAKYLVGKLEEVRYIKSITREPKSVEELARTSFPHCLIETTDESREDYSMGSTDSVRTATISFLINIVVYGDNRDSQRNLVIEAVERKLEEDRNFGGLLFNSGVSEVLTREIDTDSPYATGAIVYSATYHYDRAKP